MNNVCFKALSLNVRGLRDLDKRKSIFTWVKNQEADIIFLQETYSTPDVVDNWKYQWSGEMFYSHGSNHNKGVLVLIRDTLQFELKSVKNDTRGRFVIVEALVQESPVLLINIYAPNKTNEAVDFYEDLRSTLLESDYDQDHKFIIGGDFNVPLSLALDSNGSKTEKKDVVKKIHDLMLDFNLIDIWRLRNPDKKRFTWKQKNPFIQRRLDYWLISHEFQDNVDNTDIISAIKTDHAAIFLQIDSIEKQPTGPSYWKLNSSLLDDQKYIELIKDNIPLWLIEFKDVSDKRVLWDLIKYKIRQVSMKYSKTKAKERRNHLSEIEKKLKERQESFDANPTEDNSIQLEMITSEYNSLYDNITEGNIIRSRANWYEHGEKNNKYFLNLECKKMSNSCVRKLFDKRGKLITSPKSILSELSDFYTDLYSKNDPLNHDVQSNTFLDDCLLPTLTDDAKNMCEGALTNSECFNALQRFHNGKSPGNDGLTAEFYKVFWPTLGHLLVNSLNSSFEIGELANSQKQGIIKLIEKKHKDKRHIANWRPISLLNVDVKIASKALTLRLGKVLSDIISPDQCAYVKGRNNFDAVRTINDIMDYTNFYNLPGLMVTIDFEKAFDSLSWNFLIKTLEKFNFGKSFIQWVRILYTNISSCIMNNGVATPLFSIGRGVRQGDPLSPYLFILALETLLASIKQNPDIKGIEVDDKEIKCIAFADDLTNFLRDKESYAVLSSLLETYGKCSGLKLNKDKKEAYWLGSSHYNHDTLDINKVNEPIKILGIFFTYDRHKSKELNFDLTLKSLKKSLNCWQWRNLTLIGKIQLVKTLAMPKFMYRASLISFDKDIIKSINSVIFNFVWKGKDKIKRLALISSYEDGGLKMPHPESLVTTQRIACIKKYLDENASPWKVFLSHYLKNIGSSFLLQCNFKSSNLPSKLPIFYKECLEAWSDFNAHTPTTKQEVLNEIIWNNQNLLINKQSIYNKKIKDAGFVKLSDILSNNSKLKSWEFFRKNNLSLSDYLLLLGVFSAIPPRWKLLLKNEGTCNIDPTDKTASKDAFQDISTMNSKSIYSAMIKLIQIPPTAQLKFNSLYNIPDILDWKNIYQLPGRVTLDTRTRAFQYKILNRILYTNRILCKMKLVPSPLCTFCGDHEETLEHLFINCTFSKKFWLSVITWLNGYDMKIDKLDEITILFGIPDNNPDNYLLNHIIIMGKQTIYLCRYKNIKPSLSLLKTKTKETKKLELIIAKKNKKESLHYKKWQNMSVL